MIYLINVPTLALCKVGYAKSSIKDRMRLGAPFIPAPFIVAATRPGGRRLEAAIHREAAAFHAHGEWFRNFSSVSEIFSRVTVPQDDSKTVIKVQALSKFMKAGHLSPGAMASLVGGVTESGVRKWVYGERIPRPDQLRRIAEVTNGSVMPNDFILADEGSNGSSAGEAA